MDADQTSPHPASTLASQLLDAQSRWWHERLTGPTQAIYLTSLLDLSLANAKRFTLGDMVRPEQIHQVIRDYAFDLNLGAGILELIGQIAHRIHALVQHSELGDQLLSWRSTDHWINKLLEMDHLRVQLAQQLQHSREFPEIIQQAILLLLEPQLQQWRDKIPSMSGYGTMAELSRRLAKTIAQQEHRLADSLSQIISQQVHNYLVSLLQRDSIDLKELVQSIWDSVSHMPLQGWRDALTADDVEDFLVLGYEDWRQLRKQPFLQQCILAGVDVFFEQYNDFTLQELLDEVGVNRIHMQTDLLRFIPPILSRLDEAGVLIELIRGQLAPFYQSVEFTQIAQHHVAQPAQDTPAVADNNQKPSGPLIP